MVDSTIKAMTSNKPYLVKAYYHWISDNDLTPYIMVDVNVYGVLVPMSYVVDGQIVLNIASSAVGSIALGNESIEFSARFGGKLENLSIPYGAVGAIYAKENGAGTSLTIEHPVSDDIQVENEPKTVLSSVSSEHFLDENKNKAKTKRKGKASLTIIK